MATITMLIGLPGSGKTTFAKSVENEGNSKPCKIHVVSSDTMREKLYGSEEIQGDPNEVFECVHKEIMDSLDKYDEVIFDATNLNRKYRIAFIEKVKHEKPETNICAYLFVVPFHVLYERNQNRDRKVPLDILWRMVKTFDPPFAGEGFDSIEINWSDEKSPFPSLTKLREFNQDNKHHTLSLGTHMLKAADYCKHHYSEKDDSITNYKRDRVVEAAKFHDIGKITTKTFTDSKWNHTEDAHYYEHEHVGSYLYLNHINNELLLKGSCPFDNVSEYLYVANLIDFHMKPYTSWNQSEKALNRDIRRYGKQFIDDVYKLHEADMEAK